MAVNMEGHTLECQPSTTTQYGIREVLLVPQQRHRHRRGGGVYNPSQAYLRHLSGLMVAADLSHVVITSPVVVRLTFSFSARCRTSLGEVQI